MDTTAICDCGSKKRYQDCCAPFHNYTRLPDTPEALMRSRYSAYCRANIDYIQKTMSGKSSEGFDPVSAALWAERVVWISLQVLRTSMQSDVHGQVEFVACFVDHKTIHQMHELSDFQRINGRWYYSDGTRLTLDNANAGEPISRNSPCPCGAVKKWKHCHGKHI